MANHSVLEIRYSDVASYVGFALSKTGRTMPAKVGSDSTQLRRFLGCSQGTNPRAGSRRSSHKVESQISAETLPPIAAERAAKVRSQLTLLEAEQFVQDERVARLKTSLSESVLIEKRAKQKANEQRELHSHHAKRAAEVADRIQRLKDELARLSERPAPVPDETVAMTSPAPAPAPLKDAESHGRRPSGEARKDLPPEERTAAPKPRRSEGAVEGACAGEVAAAVYRDGSYEHPASSVDVSREGSLPQAGVVEVTPPVTPIRKMEENTSPSGSPSHPHKLSAQDTTSTEAAVEQPLNEVMGYLGELQKPQYALTKEELSHLNNLRRKVVRKNMIELAGTARKAFATIDLNGSGSISNQEFGDGCRRLGVPWQDLTGIYKPREFFKLFDEDKDQVITFPELFPDDAAMERAGLVRASTPDFAKRYMRERQQQLRRAEWQASGPEEEIEHLLATAELQKESEFRRKWIEATFRRLKSKGKSDARAREIVALHLPRGSGPRDGQGVATISDGDVRKMRQAYTDSFNTSIRETTKTMSDMRELRREQKQIIDRLYKATEAERARERADAAAAGFGAALRFGAAPTSNLGGTGFLNLGGTGSLLPLSSLNVDDLPMTSAPTTSAPAARPISPKKGMSAYDIAKVTGMKEAEVDDIQEPYDKVIGRNSFITLKTLPKLLKAVAPNRTLAQDDINAFWKDMTTRQLHQQDDSGSGASANRKFEDPKKAQCSFEQFAFWFANSELRTAQQPGN
mmetsp:Transcript_1785/g.4015  ORF Transcript_1785/g.4015 Transcript_1785/m.4015 type:complete len:746 (-) Transcript_1785:84-2321(-)|eukprot:CAMPEP_0206478318 /NCGR_PEP_ID=MMETSP0324_2-20121206/35957_1 /ASSEMBLY_ACC=CAM_ASM_000836 /TAXON_ID=2866 /ORGANISM="Crypthecodinium cohnii, Strain Seligo" /LENGTH=745 /DNA_ID=CAMNT_0053954551 /DNA_START=27 /DNA_END=2264 /DNA_ORIENTATION=-